MLKTFSGRRASQNEWELRAFIELLKDHGVRRYLEIGARHGDTFHETMLALPKGATGIALDYPGALWGVKSSREALTDAVTDLHRRGYDAYTIFGDSKSADIQGALAAMAGFDAILIDGDHTYSGVSADWRAFGGMAQIVAFHDIVGAGQAERVTGREVEVPRLWAEIKASGLRTVEFVAPDSAMGIGVVLQ